MKNSVLLSLLAASLFANAWLLWSRASASSAPGNSSAAQAYGSARPLAGAPSSASAARATNDPAARQPFVWKNPGTSDSALRAFASELRAAGFPPNVVASFVGEMLRDRTFAAVLALPHWQLKVPGKETRKLQIQAARELLRLQEEILGPSGSPAATLEPLVRSRRFGDLSDDKVNALLRIERDYDELRGDVYAASAYSSEEITSRQQQQRTIEKERLADIAAALSPEEYADWERRESGSAKRVMNSLQNLDVSEEEYLALLSAQKIREPNGGISGVFSLDDTARNLPATNTFIDSVRTTLGDERANTYLKSSDFGYAQAASFAEKHPAVTPEKTFELFKIQNEAQALMLASRTAATSGSAPTDPNQLRQQITALNARLDALLGATTAEAYRSQGMGSMLRAFAPRPTTTTPPKS